MDSDSQLTPSNQSPSKRSDQNTKVIKPDDNITSVQGNEWLSKQALDSEIYAQIETQPKPQSNLPDTNLTHQGFGPLSVIEPDHFTLSEVDSVARDLNIDSNSGQVDNPISNPLSPDTGLLNFDLAPPILNPGIPIQAVDNLFNLNKIAGNSRLESSNSIDFNAFDAGVMLNDQNWLRSDSQIEVQNLGNGPDVATLLNTDPGQNLIQNLQQPWNKGNLQNQDIGQVLIISSNDFDQNNDNLIDIPFPEGGNPSGILSISFDNPIYEFGWDIFNLEYGPEIQNSEITFYDKHGRYTTIPFESFLDSQSAFYDSTLLFGSNSANRIQPIRVEDLALSEIIKLDIVLAQGVGVANFNWVEQKIELQPNILSGNLMDNDILHGQTTYVDWVSFEFPDLMSAQNYQNQIPLLNTQIEGNSVLVSSLGSPIMTPLGGELIIQTNGEFKYTPPISPPTGSDTEIFNYHISTLTQQSSEAQVTIQINDNLPQANDLDNFANSGTGLNNYNLVLTLDVSGSMDANVYNHSRLELAQDALVQLIDKLDLISDNLNITIIPFASNAGLDGAFAYEATSVNDAKDFILKQNTHQTDGIEIQMINPDTGQPLGRSTHYDTALYHARDILEQQITDPNLQDYEHVMYFISDGVPNASHTALDQGQWPAGWGSWQDFVTDPKSEVAGALTDHIEVFAVGIDPDESLQAPLQPIASPMENIIEPDSKLFTFSQKLLDTLPDTLSGNVLVNDLFAAQEGEVTQIEFAVNNPANFILSHQLNLLGATVNASNDGVIISLPQDGSVITMDTPLGGKLFFDNGGNYTYVPPNVASEQTEVFTYTLLDTITQKTEQADLNLHIYPNPNDVTAIEGTHGQDIINTQGEQGVLYLSGGREEDQFIIDLSNQNTSTIYITDLDSGLGNQLKFSNVSDKNADGVIDLFDVFSSFSQGPENSNVIIGLDNSNPGAGFNGTQLILQDVGTIHGTQIQDLISHLQEVTTDLSII